MLKGIKFKVDRTTLSKLYKSMVRPIMEYADVLWDGRTESESDLLKHVPNTRQLKLYLGL